METLALCAGVHHQEDRSSDGDWWEVRRSRCITRRPSTDFLSSPIVTWLPNQLFAVMDLMTTVWKGIADADKEDQPRYVFDMMTNVTDQRAKLSREVDRWCQERGV